MRIPEDKIEQIRSTADIVDVISGYVQLKKRGKNYVGLCPFHQEKTPSFTVSNDKQIYHCFGCHSGGNVFKFLMEYKSISFVESVQEVAEYLGITIQYEKSFSSPEQDEQEILFDINVLAAKYFSNNLLKSTEGEKAREYLNRRNIKSRTQKLFGLGYALAGWEDFLLYAGENKVDLNRAKTIGLLDTRDNGEFYDKFRDRLIFPILSPNGRVIGFGGRILGKEENTAKYLNSPESIIYHKSKSLYGLFHSKEEIRKLDKAILVEGYMDFISLYQNGVKNVVASSGTSLTEDQIRLLSRYTKDIIILFDPDPAGQKASMRSIELLLKQDFEVKVVSLPERDDPDTYINKFGKEEFDNLINSAKHFLEYQTARFEQNGMFESPSTMTSAIRELVRTIALVSDDLKQSILIKSISRKFNLREKLLETELDKFISQQGVKINTAIARQEFLKKETNAVSAQNSNRKANYSIELEKEIIKLLFEGNHELIGNIFDHIHPEDFQSEIFRYLAGLVYDSFAKDLVSPSYLIDQIEDEKIRTFVIEETLKEEPISRRWEEFFHNGTIEKDIYRYSTDVIKKLKLQKLDLQIAINLEKISTADDEKEKLELMKLNNDLEKEKLVVYKESSNSVDEENSIFN